MKKTIYDLIERYRIGENDSCSKKQEMYHYLTSRGIEFEINSEGTDIVISACAVMKDTFHLYPHEVYHHFYRNLKGGLL
ncbi:hypothetical protein ACFFK0_22805 [Paenibacillus chartarius]|uniref:Uncharacterized protein n=1 Tax=Paenibacillus chartarius TaxID=747481 RepID=A0ABV6DRE9_9BACL